MNSEAAPQPRSPHVTLIQNILRLKILLSASNGKKVAILGQPGAGKSTLIHNLTQGKSYPKPNIGVQTDATDWSEWPYCDIMMRYENYDFVDVPGYDTLNHPASVFIDFFPFSEFDVIFLVISGKIRGSDENIAKCLQKSGAHFFIIRNFSESLGNDEIKLITKDISERLLPQLSQTPSPMLLQNRIQKMLHQRENKHRIIFLSNRTREGLEKVWGTINLRTINA